MSRLLLFFLIPFHALFSQPTHAALPQHARPLIILDAGHGGDDEGAKFGQFFEKRATLSTVLFLKKYLTEMGYRVILTRGRDIFITLSRRVSIANKTRAALFVSVHYNASQSREAKGLEIFYYPDKEDPERAKASKRLAGLILHQIRRETGAESRGVKGGNFHVIRETEMPAVLVEGGFITNREERLRLKDKAYLDKIAYGIAIGVNEYFKNVLGAN